MNRATFLKRLTLGLVGAPLAVKTIVSRPEPVVVDQELAAKNGARPVYYDVGEVIRQIEAGTDGFPGFKEIYGPNDLQLIVDSLTFIRQEITKPSLYELPEGFILTRDDQPLRYHF